MGRHTLELDSLGFYTRSTLSLNSRDVHKEAINACIVDVNHQERVHYFRKMRGTMSDFFAVLLALM